MIKNIAILLLIVISTPLLFGQETRAVTLEEVLNDVEKYNLDIQVSEQKFLAARAQFRQTNSTFLPSVRISHSGFSTDNPVMAFSAKLNQSIFTAADFDVNTLNHPDRVENFTTAIELKQPLFNPDAFFGRKASKDLMDASVYQTQFTKDALLFETEKTYRTLQWAYKQQLAIDKNMLALKTLLAETQNRFDQGLVLNADVLMVEVQLADAQKQAQQAQSYLQNLSDYLQLLMGRESTAVLMPADSLSWQPTTELNNVSLPKGRADLQALQLTEEAYKKQFQAQKWSYLPALNAFGNIQWFDNSAFNTGSNSYFVGAELTWDIFKGYQRLGKTEQTKADFEKIKLENRNYRLESQNQLKSTYRELQDAQKMIELSQLALQQATEQLHIQKNRFKEGLEKTSEVLRAEYQATQMELSYYEALLMYHTAKARLQFLLKS